MEENRFLGNIYGHGPGYAGAVWDKESIAPTLTTMQGGGREPMIVEAEQVQVKQATKDGHISCDIGGGMRPELPRQYNTQRSSARERSDMSNANNGEYP